MKLMTPLSIRGMTLRNRVVMPPMQTNFRLLNPVARGYHVERARGGVGLIIPGAIPVDPFRSDKIVKGLRDWIVAPVHEQGAKIGVQIWHGNLFPCGDASGTWVAPSPGVRWHGAPEAQIDCRELKAKEIKEIISAFVSAAVRARETGFDMVELHGAHGYLIHQFFSPIDNWRTDEYGGDLWRRMRFGLELAEAVRRAVGDDYPVFWRMSAAEDRPGGITLEESIKFAQALETAGIDCIDVSFGPARGLAGTIPGPEHSEGAFVQLAEAVKRHVHMPVIAVGGIHNPEFAEAVLAQGKADLIALGRQHIADPFWVKKAAEGRTEDIRPCLQCNTCIEKYALGEPIRCAINAATSREEECALRPASQARSVLVVGGGPAGMEAAVTAAERGHRVILAEEENRLGGQLQVAAVPPYKERIRTFVEYQKHQLKRAGVEVKVGRKMTSTDVEEMKPDIVVLATGAVPAKLDIPGADGGNVAKAVDVLSGQRDAGQKVVILGGGLVGCETAEFLAAKGRKVTVIEILAQLAADMLPKGREQKVDKLRLAGVGFHTRMKAEGITEKGVKAIRNGEPFFFEADTVVLAVGMVADDNLGPQLKEKGKKVYVIGDAAQPGKIIDAVYAGARVGREI